MPNPKENQGEEFPSELEHILFERLKREIDSLRNIEWLNDFRIAVGRGYTPFYPRDWVAFNYLFFAANYLKAKKACEKLLESKGFDDPVYRILDLGCGSGATSAGILDYILQVTRNTGQRKEFTGVDYDSRQLSLYGDILGTRAQRNPLISFRTVKGSAFEFLKSNPGNWNLIVCSYMLVEQQQEHQEKMTMLLESISSKHKTNVLIIDYEEFAKDGIATCLPAKKIFQFNERSITFHLLHSLCPDVCPKYCSHQRSHPIPQLPNLIEPYFECWRKQDVKNLAHVFSSDASYEINAERQLYGLNQIADYWRQNTQDQRDPQYEVHSYVGNSKEKAVYWTLRFLRIDRNELYFVHGMLWIKIKKGRIKRLVEFYRKNVFPVKKDSPMGQN